MKYPYIGQYKEMMKVLFTSSGEGFSLEHPCIDKLSFEVKWNEDEFFNITAEYLANTYGEVKSKEHAEFIVKLASNAGFFIACDYSGSIKFFCTNNESLVFCRAEQNAKRERKLITIPLPPECESVDEWPKVGSIVEWGHTGKGEVKSLSDGFAWIKLDNKDYTTVYVSSLRKPKTPEQELAEKLIEKYKHLGKKEQAIAIAKDIVQNAIDKYNITKKPQ